MSVKHVLIGGKWYVDQEVPKSLKKTLREYLKQQLANDSSGNKVKK